MPAQPFDVNIDDREGLKLLLDNIDNLKHPSGQRIPHPYFNDPTNPNRDGLSAVRKRFCEAILLCLENCPQDAAASQWLADHLPNLEHPEGWVKNAYFQTICNPRPEDAKKMAGLYAEAIVLLLNNRQPKRRPGRPRKDADA